MHLLPERCRFFRGELFFGFIGEPIKRSFVAYYIDSGASAEQREALRKLFTGPSFAAMGQPAELKEVAINFENLDAFGQVGKTASGTAGEIAKVEVYADLAAECSFAFRRLLEKREVILPVDGELLKQLSSRRLQYDAKARIQIEPKETVRARGIARVSITEALGWVKSDSLFVRPDPDGRLLTTREVRDAENKMIKLAAQGRGKHGALSGGKAWAIRHPLVASSEEQSEAVHHVLASQDFVVSLKGPAGAGKTDDGSRGGYRIALW